MQYYMLVWKAYSIGCKHACFFESDRSFSGRGISPPNRSPLPFYESNSDFLFHSPLQRGDPIFNNLLQFKNRIGVCLTLGTIHTPLNPLSRGDLFSFAVRLSPEWNSRFRCRFMVQEVCRSGWILSMITIFAKRCKIFLGVRLIG